MQHSEEDINELADAEELVARSVHLVLLCHDVMLEVFSLTYEGCENGSW